MFRSGIEWEPFGRPKVANSIPEGSEKYREVLANNKRLIDGYANLSQAEISSVMHHEASMETELKIALISLREVIDRIESIMQGKETLANINRGTPVQKGNDGGG